MIGRFPLVRCLLAALVVGVLVMPATVRAEARIALVIGNSAYGSPLGALKNPANDAKLISSALKQVGFRVTTLLDADQRAMKRAISEFGEAVENGGRDSVALFFYAGHGIQVGGINYLVPVGARIERQGDVDLEAIEAETVLKQLEYAGAEVSIVVLDACRNNPLPRSFRSADRGLARMDAPTGSFVAYSTAPGDVAADGEGANSPFAAALSEEVRQPGASVEEVFRSVRRKVMSATAEKQVPWDSSSLTAPFYFLPASQQVASVQPSQPALSQSTPTQAAGSDQMLSAEMLMWESIKDSSRPGDFSAYLKRFPDGVYADLARNRLDELSGSSASTQPAASSQSASAAPEPEPVAEPEPAPEPQPQPEMEVAALPAQDVGAAATTGGGGGRQWLVDAGFKPEIEKYLEKAQSKGRQVRALAIAKDGASIGIGLYTPKAESGWASGGGNVQDSNKAASEEAIRKCGGKNRCIIAYVGAQRQGNFDLVFGDGTRVAALNAAPVVEPESAPAPAEAEVPQSRSSAEPSGAGDAWVVSQSLQPDIDAFLASAAKGGRQVRVLAIAKDGSKIGVGLHTPKAESGWASGGGNVQDAVKVASELALKKCGGKDECRIAYVGEKKQGNFQLVYQ